VTHLSRSIVAGLVLVCGLPSCRSPERTFGPPSSSGLARTSREEFELLVYPCGDHLIEEVSLLYTADRDALPELILRQRYDPPVSQSAAEVSTALAGDEPGREIVDAAMLRRFNTDRQLVETVDTDFFFSITALDTQGVDVSGGVNLGNRFDIPIGKASVVGYGIFRQSDMKCADGQPAWPGK
jgi:hypothetical protein